MSISYEAFLNWAESKFDSVKVTAKDILLNSIYDPDGNDTKHKLSCRPELDGRPAGVYKCWISEKKGTLIGLVRDVEKCSYDEACAILEYGDNNVDQNEKLEQFFRPKKQENTIIEEPKTVTLSMPPDVTLIHSLNSWTMTRKNCEDYLVKRHIPSKGLYVGTAGEYRERIVIPYYDNQGQLIYYNGRYIGSNSKILKYKGPDKEIGVGKGDVIFMPDWNAKGTLHVTEGEFDAIVLNLCGLTSCAVGGANLSQYQQKTLKNYQVCLCGDNDNPGANAVFRAGNQMLEAGFKNISFVRPPIGYKDWNDLYIKIGDLILKYIKDKTKPFDLITSEQLFAR